MKEFLRADDTSVRPAEKSGVDNPARSPSSSLHERVPGGWCTNRVVRMTAAITLAAIGVGCFLVRHVTLNVTKSMPLGLYWLRPRARLERGTVVSFACPTSIASLVAARHYLPSTFKLLKRVVAVEGERVCLSGDRYVVGDELLSPIAIRDRLGRSLHAYPFCGVVPDGAVFVAADGDSSLDSRYFGPVAVSDLTPVVPLWTFSSP